MKHELPPVWEMIVVFQKGKKRVLYMVIGEGKSGKSKYAEALALSLRENRMIYIATMIPVGEGETGKACVRRHRAQRRGLGFVTVEAPAYLDRLSFRPDDIVLLEDVQNLLGNYLFQEHREDAVEQVLSDIENIAGRCKALIAVSVSGLKTEDGGDRETKEYIRQINTGVKLLCERADSVVLLERSSPRIVKGCDPLL